MVKAEVGRVLALSGPQEREVVKKACTERQEGASVKPGKDESRCMLIHRKQIGATSVPAGKKALLRFSLFFLLIPRS